MTIWDLLKPVVAMVHGYCLAGGSELMSMCDIAFASDDCKIGYPPMRGMTTPDVIYFPWKMAMGRAKYLQLSGNSLTGKQAAEWGWVAKSFPAEKLEEEVMHEVRALASIAPDLLAANKLGSQPVLRDHGNSDRAEHGPAMACAQWADATRCGASSVASPASTGSRPHSPGATRPSIAKASALSCRPKPGRGGGY